MKHMKTVEVPATTRSEVSSTVCDLCGAEIKTRPYSADAVQVQRRTGYTYPEGGHGNTLSVDMCGTCFDTKLVPWLKSQGAEPRLGEWDF